MCYYNSIKSYGKMLSGKESAMSDNKGKASLNGIELRIKSMYPNMGNAERKVADWIVKNPGAVADKSIIELAGLTGASEATIARFSRRLGYGGFQEMKISVAKDTSGESKIIHEKVQRSDTCSEIFSKVVNGIDETLMHTSRILDADMLQHAAEIIHNARKVLVIGLGASSSVTMDAAHKFLREGIDCTYSSDNHMQIILASHLSEKDAVLAISHSGSSKDIIEALQVAQSCGAKTISISNYGKNPIDKYSDICLHTASDETQFRNLGLSSRIAQLAIIDTMYLYIAMRRDKSALAAINKVESALQTKKM